MPLLPSLLPDVMCSFFFNSGMIHTLWWFCSASSMVASVAGFTVQKAEERKNETHSTYGVIFSFLICLQWTFRLIPYLAVVSNISVNIKNCDSIDCDYITKGESLKSLFLTFRKFHIVFYNHCIYLHSCQWCRSILFWICHILSFCKYLSRQLWDFFGT